MSDLSVKAPRWRHVQDADVSRVSAPDAARPLLPQQLGFSICKCNSVLILLRADVHRSLFSLLMVSCVSS